MYNGKKPIGENRYTLDNKSSVIAMGMSSKAWQEELLRVENQTYDSEQMQLLVTGGDGNSWSKPASRDLTFPKSMF